MCAAAAFVGCQDQSGTGGDIMDEPSGASSTPQSGSEQTDSPGSAIQNDQQRGTSPGDSSVTNTGPSGLDTNGTGTGPSGTP